MGNSKLRFGTLVFVNVAAWCVLGLYGASSAAPEPQSPATRQPPISPRQPFKNSVQQRHDMVVELREIKSLLQEQNKILKEVLKKGSTNGGEGR